MTSRGQQEFINFPRIAARLYAYMMTAKPMSQLYHQIATDLSSRIQYGRLLDVGCGPGQLLLEIHECNPRLELFGLDISKAMIAQATSNLASIPSELFQGSIESTDFPDDHFDLVTCSGSFYLWDHPVACLNEIHRILKSGHSLAYTKLIAIMMNRTSQLNYRII